MEKVKTVFIQIVEKPNRKVLIRRGKNATEYMSYCEEVGCSIWGLLQSIRSICGEPVCLWLPCAYRKNGTSEYVQGVEVPLDYNGEIPDGLTLLNFLPRSI